MRTKNQIRKDIYTKLSQFSPQYIQNSSNAIFEKLLQHPKIISAKTIFIYIALPNEVQTQNLIKRFLENSNNVIVPKMALNKQMIGVQIGKTSKFALGTFKTLEPIETKEYDKKIDVSIVPGVAFSKNGKRLGRGGGFYDKWLENHPETYTIGICFKEQIVLDIPIEDHDIFIDEVLWG